MYKYTLESNLYMLKISSGNCAYVNCMQCSTKWNLTKMKIPVGTHDILWKFSQSQKFAPNVGVTITKKMFNLYSHGFVGGTQHW